MLTSLRGRREEAYPDLILSQLVCESDDGVPRPWTNRCPVFIKIIDEVDLPTGIDGNLVTRTNAQTWIVTGAKVHDAFTSSGIGLLVTSTGDRKSGCGACRELCSVLYLASINVESGRIGTRWNVRAGSGGNTVLDVGTRDRVGVEGLDVEHNGNDVQIEPESSAEIRRLS